MPNLCEVVAGPVTEDGINIALELDEARETTRLYGALFCSDRDVEGFARVVYALERLLGRPIVLACDTRDETKFSQSVSARVAKLLADPPQLAIAPPGHVPGPIPSADPEQFEPRPPSAAAPQLAGLALTVAALRFVFEHYRRRYGLIDPYGAIVRRYKPLPLPFEKRLGENGTTTILELKIPRAKKRRSRT